MKKDINTWQQAVNSRIFTAEITVLNIPDEAATVTLLNQTIVDVPIHYCCNHGVMDHGASRVFRVGDIVSVLYYGNTDQLSSSNLVILGLKDELRRCRSLGGILATAIDGSIVSGLWSPSVPFPASSYYATCSGVNLDTYLFDGTVATKEKTSGFKVEWCNAADHIMWQWPSALRYRGSPVSAELYYQGVLAAIAPGMIYGAAIITDDQGVKWVVCGTKLTGSDITFYRRMLDFDLSVDVDDPLKPNGWKLIGSTGPIFTERMASGILCFSWDAAAAVITDGQNLYHIQVAATAVLCEKESAAGNTYYPFADYRQNELVKAIATMSPATYEQLSSYQGEIEVFWVVNDNLVFAKRPSGQVTKRSYSLSISLPFATINCCSYTETTDYDVETVFCNAYGTDPSAELWFTVFFSGTFDQGFLTQTKKNTATILSDMIVDVDLRYDYAALYTYNNTSSVDYTHTGEFIWDGPDLMLVRGDEELTSTRSLDLAYMSAGSEIHKKTISWSNGTLETEESDECCIPVFDQIITATPYEIFYLSSARWPTSFQRLDPSWLDMHDHGYESVIRAGKRFTSWVFSHSHPAYLYYTDGDPSVLSNTPATAWTGIALI